VSTGERILVVEDDPLLGRLLETQLGREGFLVTLNRSGEKVAEQVEELAPRLLILDLLLPRAHGLEILRGLRRDPRHRLLPVLILTALGAEADRIRGLELGADDYMTKPFSPTELAARVRARLRTAPVVEAELRAGGLHLDLRARTAALAGRKLELSDTEFRLLAFLMQTPGVAHTRREIVQAVWSPQHFISDRAVDVTLRRLRARLGDAEEAPGWITAVRGVGYRFDPPG
jgi:two-component system phosphate regulon response regulator PhoB